MTNQTPSCASLSVTGLSREHLTTETLNGQDVTLHPQTLTALQALAKQANNAGFEVAVASGFRDYHRQKAIWDGKFSGTRAVLDNNSQPLDCSTLSDWQKAQAILRWSALPGASRHHWGSDLDIYAINTLPKGISLQLEPWEYETGHQAEFSAWLTENRAQFGFFLPYAHDLGGVAIEPWHISHIEASAAMQRMLTLDTLEQTWQREPILGQACVMANKEVIFERFIANISPAH